MEGGGGLPAAAAPADAGAPGGGQVLPRLPGLLHGGAEGGVDLADADHQVDVAAAGAQGVFGGGHLGGAGGDKDTANLRRGDAQAPGGLALDGARGQLHRGHQWQDIVQQLGEAHPDQPQHRRAGGGDDRALQRPLAQQQPGGVADQLGGGGHLVNLVKAHLQQPRQHHLGIVQVVKLAVKGGGRQGYFEPEAVPFLQMIRDRPLGVVGTDADALAAVDAALLQDAGLAPPDPDGLGGAPFDAGNTALAGVGI